MEHNLAERAYPNLRLAVLLVAVLCCGSLVAQAPAQRARQQRKTPPVFQDPNVVEGLPNVLLIGDSISMGYHLAARKTLEGEANVFRPAVNCGPTSRGVSGMEEWLGDRKWDVIHFNFGLHDLKYMGPNGENLASPTAEGSHQQIPPDEYRMNLKAIVQRLKKTGAVLIWRETTPVPEGAKGRVVGDAKNYNELAAEVMNAAGGVQIDPFYDFALEHAAEQQPANVHYTRAGSDILGKHVAEVIRAALAAR